LGRLGVARPLDRLDRLPFDLPQLARLAPLALGQSGHARGAAGAGGDGDPPAGAPDEVGGVRADDEQAPAHPASRVLLTTVMVRISSSVKPASSRRSANSASPSSTGGLAGWPRSVESRLRSTPVARMPAKTCSQ